MTAIAAAATALSLVVSTVALVVVVLFVWWLDRYDREPIQLVAGAFLWGAGVAPLLVSLSGTLVPAPLIHPAAAAFLVGLLEELSKAIVVVLVARYSADFDTPTDGLVYGTAAGLGFAAAENLMYIVAGAGSVAGSGLTDVVVGRTLFTAGVHGLASGVVGGFIGIAYLSRGLAAKAGWVIFGVATGVTLHAGWNLAADRATQNGPDRPWLVLVALPLLYALYLGAFVIFLRWEHRVLRTELEEEATLRLVPAWVPDVIPFYRRRIRSDWWPRREERAVLSRLLTRLAFRKLRLASLSDAEAAVAALEIVRLRTRVRCMLAPTELALDDEIVKPLSK